MNIPGYENTVVCPYNKAHVILKSRFQVHLVRCKRANPEIQLVKCTFDSTHHLRKDEIAAHEDNCPSRESFDQYMYNIAAANQAKNDVEVDEDKGDDIEIELPPKRPSAHDTEDNWGDAHVATYDAQSYARTAPVLRIVNLITPSQRNQFRIDARRRMAEMQKRQN